MYWVQSTLLCIAEEAEEVPGTANIPSARCAFPTQLPCDGHRVRIESKKRKQNTYDINHIFTTIAIILQRVWRWLHHYWLPAYHSCSLYYNSLWLGDAILGHGHGILSAILQAMKCRVFGAKPLPKPADYSLLNRHPGMNVCHAIDIGLKLNP